MKKIISMTTCLIILTCMLMVPEIEVYAEEGYTQYNFDFHNPYNYSSYSDTCDVLNIKGVLTVPKDYELIFYISSSYINSLIIDSAGNVKDCSYFLSNIGGEIPGFSWQGSCVFYRASKEEGSILSELGSYSWLTGDFRYYSDVSWAKYSVNTPIFESKEQAMQYIAGDIDEKSAINYKSDLCDIIYDLEVPQNMKLTCTDTFLIDLPYYTMKWEQTDENYKDWTTEIYVYVSLDAWKGILGIKFGESFTYDDLFLYGDKISTYKLKYVMDVDSNKYEKAMDSLNEYIFSINHDISSTAVDYYKVYMRNFYFDGKYRHYSNWLLVEFDYEFESGQGDTSIIEMGGSVNDNPGESNPEQDFVGDVVGDSQYTGEINGNLEESKGDILSWIKNGFGIGGDSGIIAMLSDSFDFIPPEMWAVMMSGIALMVGVAVFKFIRG